MLILACGGRTYARLRFGVGPRASVILPIEIDFGAPGPSMDPAAWEQEYADNVLADDVKTPARPAAALSACGQAAASQRQPATDNDPFFDPARFDPWESYYGRYF
jgi:hypothetical protein